MVNGGKGLFSSGFRCVDVSQLVTEIGDSRVLISGIHVNFIRQIIIGNQWLVIQF